MDTCPLSRRWDKIIILAIALIVLSSSALAQSANVVSLKADAVAGKGPLAKFDWKPEVKEGLIDSAALFWDAFRRINREGIASSGPVYVVRPESEGCLIYMDNLLMHLDGSLPSRVPRDRQLRLFSKGAMLHKSYLKAVKSAIAVAPTWANYKEKEKASGKQSEASALETMITTLAGDEKIQGFDLFWNTKPVENEAGESDFDLVKRIVKVNDPNDPYMVACARLDPAKSWLGTPRKSTRPAQESGSTKASAQQKTESGARFSDPDWKNLIGKDIYYTYTSLRKLTTFGGDNKEKKVVQTTRMKVREVKDTHAFVLFWDDAAQKEPLFAGWIDTTINTELPAIDIESHPAFILGGQFSGGDYSNMRQIRVGGAWAKEFNPRIVKWANDIVPFYGLSFRKERKSGESYIYRVTRPATFFSGEGNTFGDITVAPTVQPDGTWIVVAKFDVSNAADKRLGGGDIRARFAADGLLQSFEQSVSERQFKIDGVAGTGTIKWTIQRTSTPPSK